VRADCGLQARYCSAKPESESEPESEPVCVLWSQLCKKGSLAQRKCPFEEAHGQSCPFRVPPRHPALPCVEGARVQPDAEVERDRLVKQGACQQGQRPGGS
jgi:hypothetical protein